MELIKKILILVLFMSGALVSRSQYSEKLDEKNGFKHFRLGSSPSTIRNIEQQNSNLKLKGVTSYRYNGNEITEFSGVKIEEIQLDFYNNRLFMIMIVFSNFTDNNYSIAEFNLVNSTLLAAFGLSSKCDDSEPSIINCAIWNGRKVRLDHIRMIFSGSSRLEGGYLLYVDKALEREQKLSEIL